MKFIWKLRLRSLLKLSWLIGLLLLSGALLLTVALSEAKEMNRQPVELYDVPRDELEGAYVTVEIPRIYEQYAYNEREVNDIPTGVITSKEYIIDANDNDFCGLVLNGEMIQKGDQLFTETEELIWKGTGEIKSTFRVQGVMRPMLGDRLAFYKDSVMGMLYGEDSDALLPLYLDAESGKDKSDLAFVFMLAVSMLMAGVGFVVAILCGAYQKQVMNKASELSHGDVQDFLERVAKMYDSAQRFGGLRMGDGLVLIENGAFHSLYKADELVWAYQKTVKKGSGKSFALTLHTSDGKSNEIPMNEQKAKEALERIFETIPGCVIGYREDVLMVFLRNRGMMKDVAAAQHSQTADSPS